MKVQIIILTLMLIQVVWMSTFYWRNRNYHKQLIKNVEELKKHVKELSAKKKDIDELNHFLNELIKFLK